jgi:hypothetical protein
MTGSRKWFVYTTDAGEDFALQLDESNTEAVNGETQDYADGTNIPNALPRNIKARYVEYTDTLRRQKVKCIALTQAIYQGLINGDVASIDNPNGGGQLNFIAAVGEARRLPFSVDTGLIDGDAT